MRFEILGEISGIETFAVGSAIREVARLRRIYGQGRWRKRKGVARVRLQMAQFVSLRYTGTRRPGLAAKNSRSSICFEEMRSHGEIARKQLFVCIDNDGHPASLEQRKIYVALQDGEAEEHGLLRIIDESGDDYLYPKALFRLIELPETVRKAVLAAA